MIVVNVKKGYLPKILGAPSNELDILEKPSQVALLPEKIPFIKPRLKARLGDNVKIGTLLVEDKRNPDILFLSPGGGKITDIDYGPRRVIRKIVIDLDDKETYETFPVVDGEKLDHLEKNELRKIIMSGGLWPLLKELPFRNIANPDSNPPYIIISLDAQEPFQPLPEVYLKNNADLFEFGIKILKKLADTIFISTSFNNKSVIRMEEDRLTHLCRGEYPADDPGVLSYHIKKSEAENKAWFIGGQDVLLLARLLLSGKYPVQRIVVTGGNLIHDGKHVLTRTGVPLSHLAGALVENKDPVRWIMGGLFRGYTGTPDS
jgi:Na+-transporting NADH:ubiquinone oxidoreductase subunit A